MQIIKMPKIINTLFLNIQSDKNSEFLVIPLIINYFSDNFHIREFDLTLFWGGIILTTDLGGGPLWPPV